MTGTASWNFYAISQYILGIRPHYNGLIVEPCVPKSWKEFTITRKFRGATYHIRIENPNGANKGVKVLLVNGIPQKGNLIPILPEGHHQIVVQL